MQKTVKILGIRVHLLRQKAVLEWIEEAIQKKESRQIITGNPEMIMAAQKNERFFQIMNQADLIVPDGIGLVLAIRYFLKEKVPERVTGFDLSTSFFELAIQKGYSIYLLGGAPKIAEKAAQRLIKIYPGLQIKGTHHGYLTEEECPNVIKEIASLKPDLLLVGMGAPRQEYFITDHKEKYGVPVSIGIGGSIDHWAGEKRRAPLWMQNLHLEWFYRLIQEPRRFLRLLALPKFVFYAAFYKEGRLR